MNRTQIPTPHHELSFGGMAPWPPPGVISMTEIRKDPASRCCEERGRGRELITDLVQQSTATHGPVPSRYLVLAR